MNLNDQDIQSLSDLLGKYENEHGEVGVSHDDATIECDCTSTCLGTCDADDSDDDTRKNA